MRYLGGKKKLGKEIASVLSHYGDPNKVDGYIEPFCGSLGVMVHMVDKGYKTCKAYDSCKDLILLWKALKADKFKFPKSVSERTWLRYKNDKKPSAMRAFIGFGCSFGGIWFSGYAQKYYKNYENRTPALIESIQSTKNLIPFIKKINIIGCKDYKQHRLKNHLIYCDPPYSNTVGYKAVNTFNNDEFWNKVREWSKNNIVIVSEYTAPKDFKCIWTKKRKIGMSRYLSRKSVKDNLYMYKSLYKLIKNN